LGIGEGFYSGGAFWGLVLRASQESWKLMGRFVGGELLLAAWREVFLKGGGFGLPQRFMGARPVGGQGKPLIAFEGLRRGASEVFGWID